MGIAYRWLCHVSYLCVGLWEKGQIIGSIPKINLSPFSAQGDAVSQSPSTLVLIFDEFIEV
jgi:hypothetical protein